MNLGIDELPSIKRAFNADRLLALAEAEGLKVRRGQKPRMQCPSGCSDDARGCSVQNGDDGAGWFNCHRPGCDARGTIIDFLKHRHGLSEADAIARARELAGRPWEPPKKKQRKEDEPLTDAAVVALWEALGKDGPEERAYLRSRQLDRALDRGLWRVNHERVPNGYAQWCARQGLRVAMGIYNPHGELVSMQFRAIGPVGAKSKAKLSLKGTSYGHAGFFGDPLAVRKAPRAHIAEGMADTAAVWQQGEPTVGVPGIDLLHGVLACLGNVRARTFVLYPQVDPKGQSQTAFGKLEEELKQRGAIVRVVRPPEGFKDPAEWNADVGPDAFKAAVDAVLVQPVVVPPPPPDPVADVVDLHPSPPDSPEVEEELPTPIDGRPQVRIGPDVHLVNEASARALAADPAVFQRNNLLVHVARDQSPKAEHGFRRAPSAPKIVDLPPLVVQDRLSRVATFYKFDKKQDEWKRVAPPKDTAAAVVALRQWPGIRQLRGFTEVPVLIDTRGTVLDTPGYDLVTGLLFEPTATFLPVPETPTLDDARSAVAEILDDVMVDFPWEHPSHRAAWLAMLLTMFARHAFDGPAPAGIADANIRGAGKGLMVDVIALIFTGRDASRGTFFDDDDEMNKQITSVLLAGDPLVLLDDIDVPFGGSPMQKLTTATTWSDRLLGGNDRPTLDAFTVWFATGNNLVLAKDMARRVLHMRLLYKGENPEDRTNFRHQHLKTYVRENRPRLVRAALIILRAYCLAGCPDMGLVPWGSFEGWSRLIRHCVVWLGLNDPRELAKELERTSDSATNILQDLVFGLDELRPGQRGLTAREIIQRLEEDTQLARHHATRHDLRPDEKHVEGYAQLRGVLDTIAAGKRGYDSTRLGNKLRDFRDRHVGGKHIAAAEKDRNHVQRWTVLPLPHAGGAGGEGTPQPPRTRNAETEQRDIPLPFFMNGACEPPAAPAPPAAPTLETSDFGQRFVIPNPDDDGR